jgi:hypothetical protein
MTSKTVSWSALVNLGHDESLGLTVTGEAGTPDEARDIFAFAVGQLLGVAKSADETTAALVRAYVSRLVTEEEAKPAVRDEKAPAVKIEAPPVKEPWTPKITKSSYEKAREEKAARTPTPEEQAAAAVAACIKPAAPQPTPSAPPTPEASTVATAKSAPPVPTTAPDGEVCGICGASVTKSQAKLSQLFMSKTLCKPCMDKSQGAS